VAKKYDVCAVVGEKKDGSPVWKNFGAVFQTEKGFAMKLDSMPIAKDFDGWFKLFTPRDNNQQQPAPRPAPASEPYDDPVPF
jgi:hypothetical protein